LAGIELRDFDLAARIASAAIDRGLILRALPSGTLQVSPPLIAGTEELELAAATIRELVVAESSSAGR
jgi:adenosylmethionine-8-amino-7-oxononanoate aminotransferase